MCMSRVCRSDCRRPSGARTCDASVSEPSLEGHASSRSDPCTSCRALAADALFASSVSFNVCVLLLV